MIEGTTCEFCGKHNHSKSALYSHRKRCTLYQKYKSIVEDISLAVKTHILNNQEVPVEDLIHEATESIDETINEIKKKNIVEPVVKETIVEAPKIERIPESNEELTANKSYEKFVRDTIQDMYVQMGEIRMLVRRLVENKELKNIKSEND